MGRNCLYSSIGIAIVCLCAEIILRIITPFSQPLRFYTQYSRKVSNDYRADIKPDCQLIPNTILNGFVINSQGNYSPEYTFTKPRNTKRIVVIGDSALTSVVPYPNSFIRLVEQQLQSNSDYQIQMVNLGIACIGPLAEKEILKESGSKYEPDVVLLVFSISNDFTDDEIYIDGYNRQIKTEPFVQKLIRQSYIASFLKTQYYVWKTQIRLQNIPKTAVAGTYIGTEYDAVTPSFSESDYINLTRRLADILIPDNISKEQMQSVQQSITEMKQISDSLNAAFVVLLIPAEFQINIDLLTSAASVKEYPMSNYDIAAPQRMLRTFFEQNNIRYIDILPNWQGDPEAASYYHPRDTHLNISGNRSVANFLYPALEQALDNKNKQ